MLVLKLWILLLSCARVTTAYSYAVCNGLANQLVSHIGSIAHAYQHHKSIRIPDAFIVNGVQLDRKGSALVDVYASKLNSVPFSKAFDDEYFLEALKDMQIKASFHPSNEGDTCAWNWEHVRNADVVQKLLRAFRPSKVLKDAIAKGIDNLVDEGVVASVEYFKEGVCVHDRNGHDWTEHCKQWESINDGIWRKNCLDHTGSSMRELVLKRIPSTKLPPEGLKAVPMYMCSDDGADKSFTADNSLIVTRLDMIGEAGERALLNEMLDSDTDMPREEYLKQYRDIWALFDFYACEGMENFVGNSVSTFSVMQIILRNGNAAWYNSRSIPLADNLAVPIPLVYTYTEASPALGQTYLKVAITSARKALGESQPINVMYHGGTDFKFLKWLRDKNVIVHNHEPEWGDVVANFRKVGDPTKTHLFANAGATLGTWQRIDVPLFIKSEYCLLMDYDTLVVDTFGIHEFGLQIPKFIGMALEDLGDIVLNAGVTLFNVPQMRATRGKFLRFIKKRSKAVMSKSKSKREAFKSGPMDQGAYVDFFKLGRFHGPKEMAELSSEWNVKAYWRMDSLPHIRVVHFHGAKPHDYIKTYFYKHYELPLDNVCPIATNELCTRILRPTENSICSHMGTFAKMLQGTDLLDTMCNQAFDRMTVVKPENCITALSDLGSWMDDNCIPNFDALLVKAKFDSNKEEDEYDEADKTEDEYDKETDEKAKGDPTPKKGSDDDRDEIHVAGGVSLPSPFLILVVAFLFLLLKHFNCWRRLRVTAVNKNVMHATKS